MNGFTYEINIYQLNNLTTQLSEWPANINCSVIIDFSIGHHYKYKPMYSALHGDWYIEYVQQMLTSLVSPKIWNRHHDFSG